MKKIIYIFMVLLALSTVGCEKVTELETSMPEAPVTDSVAGVTSDAAYIVMGNSKEIVVSKSSDFSDPYYSSTQIVYKGKKCICIEKLSSGTTYYYAACAINSGYNQEMRGDVKSFTTLTDSGGGEYTSGTYVDLGLSVKWATCNLGASTPTEYGGLYGWADPTGTKTTTSDTDYPSANPPSNICGTVYDIARAKLGGNWRLPSSTEMSELINSCSHTMVVIDGVYGIKFTSLKNGNTLFLPAAGWRSGTSYISKGSTGSYWSGSLDKSSAYNIFFSVSHVAVEDAMRNHGHSVRPVCK